jgi:hypothetical protein
MIKLKLPIFALSISLATLSAHGQQLFTDGFETANMTHAENSITWAGGAYTSITSAVARTGKYSLRFAYQAGSDSWTEQRFNLGKDYKELTVEWYAYYPNGIDGLGPRFIHRNNPAQGDNNKLIRLWKGDPADGADGYGTFYVKVGASSDLSSKVTGDESVYAEYGTYGGGVGQGGSTGNGPGANADPLISDAQRGRWVAMKYHAKVASAANNDGVIELWRDGIQLFSGTKMPMYPANGIGNAFNFGYLMGWANSGFDTTTYVYIDDVRISASTIIAPVSPTSLTVQ